MSSLLLSTRAELYKTRHHRLPYVVTLLGMLAAAAPGVYFLFRAPSDVTAYSEAAVAVAGLYTILGAAVFGGWILGHEYRQGTLRRVLAIDAARQRVLGAKAIAGVVTLALMTLAIVGAGLGVGAIAAAVNDASMSTAGMGRDLLSLLIPALITGVVAFGCSATFRSDTYATLAALGLVIVFAPLLTIIPTVGPYTLGALSDAVSGWVGADQISPPEGATATLLGLGGWLTFAVGSGAVLFARRDL